NEEFVGLDEPIQSGDVLGLSPPVQGGEKRTVNGRYRIGVDENGLGAPPGPLVVTAGCAQVDGRGERLLRRRLPARVRQDLDDSKRLVSHHDVALGEAWARALPGCQAQSPDQLFRGLSFEDEAKLLAPCPEHASSQCWSATPESFVADASVVARLRGHL